MSSTTTSAATVVATAAGLAGLGAGTTQYYSTTFTSIIACLVPLVALIYLAIFSWFYHRARQNPKAVNKASGRHIQRYAPGMVFFDVFCFFSTDAIVAVYMYFVFLSLVEVS